MSQRYLGGVITANPTAPTLSNGSGVWTLEQQLQNSSSWAPTLISQSLRLRLNASAYLNRTPTTSNRKTYTWSAWVKRGSFGTNGMLFDAGEVVTPYLTRLTFQSDDTLRFINYNSTATIDRITSQVFRDPAAWYHIMCVVDTTQATAADRAKLYVNGAQITALSTNSTSIAQGTDTAINYSSYVFYMGRNLNTGDYFDGYMANVYFVDGQALTPSSFGAFDTNGVWQPLQYTGNYGTNGFYLTFADNSAATAAALGKDYSGNGNNWTPNNISLTAGVNYDWMLDSPTNYADGGTGRGNYCVLNSLNANLSSISLSGGNLNVSTSASNVGVTGSIGMSTGQWYWETTFTNSSGVPSIGAARSTWDKSYVGYTGSVGYHANGIIYNNGINVQSGLATYTSGDVIGVSLDISAGIITFYKNNVQQATVTGLVGEWFPAVAGQTSSTLSANFGQRPFSYTPPTGFKALNTQNLPAGTVNKGNQYFNATTYTGNGGALTVTNSGSMKPDLLWVKQRGSTTFHYLQDSVRGVNKALFPNSTDAEYAGSSTTTSFNTNGFSFNGSESSLNTNAGTYVGWQWKESTTAGLDIVLYTGTGSSTILSHSLGVAPKMMIVKTRSVGTYDWCVYHSGLTSAAYYVALNRTFGETLLTDVWNGQAPSSTNFYVGSSSATNASGQTLVAYLWAEVAGYSKFGSYTGNGSSTDGTFVYCGFSPKYIMTKRIDSTSDWQILDSSRSPYNPADARLWANSSAAEVSNTSGRTDFLSNGFKFRNVNNEDNGTGYTYIFAAFAENPFSIARAR